MVWIAQGVDFSTPCRQRLITFKPLTSKQKYKAEFPSAKSLKTSASPRRKSIPPADSSWGTPHRKTCGQPFMADICGANVLTTHRKTCGQPFMADICGANVLTTHRKTCGQPFMADICGANVLTTHRKTCGQPFMADICGANVLTLRSPSPSATFQASPFA